METQVSSVVCSVHFHFRLIAQLRSYLDVGALTTLVHALVVLSLDYCALRGAAFETDMETSDGAEYGSQTSYRGEKVSPYFPHPGRLALTAYSLPR